MLVALKRLIDSSCLIEEVYLCDINVVVGENLTVGDELALVNMTAIEIKSKLLSKPVLNRVHIGLVAEGQVIDRVGEVERMAGHVEHLRSLTEGVGRKMEVSWHLIDYDGSLHQATLLALQSLDCLGVDLVWALAYVCKVSVFIHLAVSVNLYLTKSCKPR